MMKRTQIQEELSSDEEDEFNFSADDTQPLPFLFTEDEAKPRVLINISKSAISDDLIEIWLYPDSGKLEMRIALPPPPAPPPGLPPSPPPGLPPQLRPPPPTTNLPSTHKRLRRRPGE